MYEFWFSILYNSSEILFSVALILTHILWLRIFYLLGLICLIISGYFLDSMTVVGWGIFHMVINGYAILQYYLLHRAKSIPKELQGVYQRIFSIMLPSEFLRLDKLSTHKIITDEIICEQSKHIDYLYFLLEGCVEVIKDEKLLTTVEGEYFIGEMSFWTGRKTSTAVKARGTVRLLAWKKEELQKLEKSMPDLYMKLKNTIGVDLIRKLGA